MNSISEYQNFVQLKGRSLAEIIPNSTEYALKIDDALKAIELLYGTGYIILGGDVLCDKSGVLMYSYENWYCQKNDNENLIQFAKRSYDVAKNYVGNILNWGGQDYYVAIVIRDSKNSN